MDRSGQRGSSRRRRRWIRVADSASKASADLLALASFKTFGQEVLITRCSNNYGPYQFPEKLIPLMITNALADKRITRSGDGLNVRDWIHVEDHCRGVMAVLLEGRPGEIYNIGGDGEMENIAVVELILETLDKPHELITYVEDRPGHDRPVHDRFNEDPVRARLEAAAYAARGDPADGPVVSRQSSMVGAAAGEAGRGRGMRGGDRQEE